MYLVNRGDFFSLTNFLGLDWFLVALRRNFDLEYSRDVILVLCLVHPHVRLLGQHIQLPGTLRIHQKGFKVVRGVGDGDGQDTGGLDCYVLDPEKRKTSE